MYKRRDVLRASAALALVAASPWLQAAGAGGLLTRKVPSTGEALPVIGAGTSGSFEVEAGSAGYQQLKAVLKAFFDGGGKVIDTSPNYGGADRILGQLLEEGGWHKQCFIATKIAADSQAEAQAQWAGTLKSLRTDTVDLLQIHNLRDWKEQLPYARELKQQGKTRYVGITHYLNSGHEDVARIVRSEPLDFIQINYSVNARTPRANCCRCARTRASPCWSTVPSTTAGCLPGSRTRPCRHGRPRPESAAGRSCFSSSPSAIRP